MPKVKCTGCLKLKREVLDASAEALKAYRTTPEGKLVCYDCPNFPYITVMSGLLRPGKGLLKAVEACKDHTRSARCMLCGSEEDYHTLGSIDVEDCLAVLCSPHYNAWSNWLDNHPEHRKLFAPRGRPILSAWLDAFREFVEDMRETIS